MSRTRKPRPNPKQAANIVADRILSLLDDGQLPPWDRPWKLATNTAPCNAISQRPYKGINIWLTRIAQELFGYEDHRWLTFNQALKAGGAVRKGETSTKLIFWKIIHKPDPSDPEKEDKYPLSTVHSLFNVEQTDGCDLPLLPEIPEPPDPIAQAEAIIAAMPNPPAMETYHFQNHPPRYIPKLDVVQVPAPDRYQKQELYYNTVYHELTHATGHPSRLARFVPDQSPDLHQRGVEELIAGMGSAMLADLAGIGHATLVPDAAYIKSWADTIRADRDIVLMAAQRSQKAVDYITNANQAQHC